PALTVTYGVRWEVQTRPQPMLDPDELFYGPFLRSSSDGRRFPSDGSVIDGNTFYKTTDCFGYAMEIGSTSTAEITGNIIWGFDTPAYLQDNSSSAGIYIENAYTSSTFGTFNCVKPVTIEGNEIYNCQGGIVVGNQFNNFAGNVDIVVDIIDNNIYDNIDEGILITDEDRSNGSSVTANITGNTISTTLSTDGDIGILVDAVGDGDLNVTLQDNTITDYDYGLYVYDWGTPAGSLFDLSMTGGNTIDETLYGVYLGTLNWEHAPVISGNNFLTNNPVQVYDESATLDLAAILAANTWESYYRVGNTIYYSGDSFIFTGIKVFLQGPYVPGGTMTHALADNSYIPLTSPYDAGVVLTALPDVSPNYIVDWVLVELRSSATSASEQDQSCFLLENGTVVDVTGNPVLAFEDTGSTNFFVIVGHRNHLGIMSAATHTFSSNPSNVTTVDLTVPGSVYGGDGLGVKVIESGILAMYSGDADGNGAVQNNDYYNVLLPQLGFNGYYMSDLNLNCFVQNDDYYNYALPNFGKNNQIPAGSKASDAPNPGKAKLNKVK
ncbi:MAG: right-handed parallel beta-helix repeat-containing protein, partial [Candidatus Cloacimonadaceae bacterium]